MIAVRICFHALRAMVARGIARAECNGRIAYFVSFGPDAMAALSEWLDSPGGKASTVQMKKTDPAWQEPPTFMGLPYLPMVANGVAVHYR